MADQRDFARELRKNQTEPEKHIWYQLLSDKKMRHKFLRQHPIGHFIVDFYCYKLRLVIEVDGDSHAYQAEYDKERTTYLEEKGLLVVRFWNNEVMKDLAGVELRLEEVIAKREQEFGL